MFNLLCFIWMINKGNMDTKMKKRKRKKELFPIIQMEHSINRIILWNHKIKLIMIERENMANFLQ